MEWTIFHGHRLSCRWFCYLYPHFYLHFPGKYFILAWPRIVNLFLFQNTLTECVKALRREPEIFKCEIPGSGKENNLKNAGHSAVLTVSLNVRSVSRQSGCRREEERSALPVQNVKQNLLKKLTKEKGLVFGYININQKS